MKPFWVVTIVISLVFFRWFIPIEHVANDLHVTSKEESAAYFGLPSTWSDQGSNGLGQYSVGLMWNWPEGVFFSALDYLGIPRGLSVFVIGVLGTIVVGIVGLNLLFDQLQISKTGKAVGIIFYLLNTYFLLLIDGGQLNLGLAYGLLPVCFGLFIKSIDSSTLRNILWLTASLIGLSIVDIRIIFLFCILSGVYLPFSGIPIKKLIIRFLKISFLVGILLAAFHAYWLIPAIFSRAPSLPNGFADSTQVFALSFATLGHAFALLQPHWYVNVFGNLISVGPLALAVPLLALIPLVFVKSKRISFWLVILIVAIFLGKGTNPPFSNLYAWLFVRVPGMSLFRDPTKFFFLISLSYSIIVAYGVDRLSQKIKVFEKTSLYLVAGYFVVITYPVWTGKMTGTFSVPRFVASYRQLDNEIKQDQSFGRVLWVPEKPALGYSSPTHQSLSGFQLVGLRPFTVGINGSYETMNFLRDASASAKLLQLVGVKYVSLPPLDPLRDSRKPEDVAYSEFFSSQIKQAEWVSESINYGQISVLKTQLEPKLFFLAPKTSYVIGSDDVYDRINSLQDNALVFAEEFPGLVNEIEEVFSAAILLNNKTVDDLAAAMVEEKYYLKPFSQLQSSPDQTGWWSRTNGEFLWIHNFLQEKYLVDNQDFDFQQGWSIAEGDRNYKFNLPPMDGPSILLTRVLHSSRSGELIIKQSGLELAKINTKLNSPVLVTKTLKGLGDIPDKTTHYSYSNYLWSAVNISTNQPVEVLTKGDLNIVNSVALVPLEYWSELQVKAKDLMTRKSVLSNLATVSYKKISPTHYKILIDNLQSPQTLVFSHSYEPFWKLNGAAPLRVFSILNGFEVTRNGEYDLVFGPQQLVLPGLVLTFITSAFIVILLKRRV